LASVRGTSADENGNISIEREAISLEFMCLPPVAKGCGGKVIVQVERKVKAGTLNPMMVKIPGVSVDAIVVAKPENHGQIPMAEPYNPALCGEVRIPPSEVQPLPFDERKVVCRRCAMEMIPNAVVNLGIGMPPGVGVVFSEEGISDLMTMTVEPGMIGGVPLGGLYFGASINADALLDHPLMFDFFDRGGLDFAVLGMAEMDQFGNVNVSKFGPRIAGASGFINITQSTRKVIFCGTFTAGGFDFRIGDGKLEIVKEGRIRKGVNLEKDILAQMDFKPNVSPDLKQMDPRIFSEKIPMGIKAEVLAKNGETAQPPAVSMK
jgi:propionate CoA-transferase